jgi:protein-disulfide isomerase
MHWLEGHVERRAGIAISVVVLLLAGRVLVSRGAHPASTRGSAGQSVEAASLGTGPGMPPAIPAAGTESAAGEALPAAAAQLGTALPEPRSATITVDGVSDIDPHKAFGSKSAPIVMEVFSDYQCPACRALFMNTNRQLMDNYVSTGKVYLVHRDFPLPMHAHSRVAAQYARAAAEIGKIEPVEKVLFENQDKWEQTGDVDGTVASVLTPAEMNKIRSLVKGGTLDSLIEKDVQLGQMYRVNQTPTSVFHSKGQTYPYSGVMSWDILRQFLDQLLGQK